MAISAGLFLALSDYLLQTRRLLRDEGAGSLYTDLDLTEFINRAMRQRDLDLLLNRTKLAWTITAQQPDYSFSDIVTAVSTTVMRGNPNLIVQDVFSLIVMPLGGAQSAIRYPLARWPYSRLAPLLSVSYPTYPAAYSIYGANTLFVGPPPAQNYPAEIDFVGFSPDLVATTDQDPMSYPFTDPIPFLAASFAKLSAQRFDEAKQFEDTYTRRIQRVRAMSRSLAVANPWADLPLRH